MFHFKNPVARATLIGQLGLIIWSLAAAMTVSLSRIPSYELLAIVFFTSFICAVVYTTVTHKWHVIAKHPPYLWVIGILGICGSEVLCVISLKKSPAAQADLINYLWPLMVIISSSIFIPKEKILAKHIIAAIIGFISIFLLLTEGQINFMKFEYKYWQGYLCAFGAAIMWTIYTLVSRCYGKATPEMFGIYCGFGLLFSICMHYFFENIVIPNLIESIILIIMGATTHCLAYFCWDIGIKEGDFKLLSILSYGNPIISVSTLILLGYAEFSIFLIISAILISIGAFIGSK